VIRELCHPIFSAHPKLPGDESLAAIVDDGGARSAALLALLAALESEDPAIPVINTLVVTAV
jgi:hypothetical protein